jgi:hypothetical protein
MSFPTFFILFVPMLRVEPAVNEASLAVAQIHLREQISTVGVCEDMSEFLLRLCGSTGMKLPFYFETNRTNGVSKGQALVSEAAKQKFIDDNSLDSIRFRDASRIVEAYANQRIIDSTAGGHPGRLSRYHRQFHRKPA